MFKNAAKLAAKVGVPNCLQLEVGPRDECQCPPNWIRPLFIAPSHLARDPRVQAHVSYDEAVTYVRGVNARIANHRSCWYKPFLACFVIGAAVFGGMMGAFHEEPRIRCKGRLCERGEDPLVDGCCMFWCCGQEMKADKVRRRRLRGRSRGGGGSKGGKKKNNVESSRGHKLKTRPYDRWDVWANETYFDDTERCALYDEKHDPLKKLDKKRDAGWGCETCPGGKSKCRTMFEGKARRHETWWPWLFLIPVLLPVIGFSRVGKYGFFETQRLYEEAFEEWFAGSVINHVEFQPNRLLLWFVGKDKAAAQKKHEEEVRARLEAQYDRNGRSDDPKKLRQQYDEQVLAGGPLRDWLDDHSAMQCAEAATPVEVKADVAEGDDAVIGLDSLPDELQSQIVERIARSRR